MSSTDNAVRTAVCTTVADCNKARSGETLVWYRGAGEYCPECGEALALRDLQSQPQTPPQLQARPPITVPNPPRSDADVVRPTVVSPRTERRTRPLRRLWFAVGIALTVIATFVYVRRPVVAIDDASGQVVGICTTPSGQQLAADLLRGFSAKSATPASRFRLANGSACGVLFSTVAQTPDAVIARDGIVAVVNPLNPIGHISEQQLRAVYSGSIRDWSQLGGTPGRIIPILPDAGSDEAKALASSLFFGLSLDRTVRRNGSSAEVTRAVTGADRSGRRAIGLVAFSQAVPAKVVPLTYLPPPSVLSIATGRYPYTLTIAVQSGPSLNSIAAQGLIDYARSSDGAAIVLKSGLIPPEAP